MKPARWLVLFLFCAGFILGCGFKDLDKRFFVTEMGVDKSQSPERPWRVTLKLVIPSAKIEPGKEDFQIVSEEGKTIASAINRMKSKVDKEFDFGHAKIIILGPSVVQKDISKTMDWFERRRDIQEIAYVMIGEPDAQTIMKIKPKSERLPANALILSFGKVGTESPYIVTEYLFDFHRRLREKGLDPVMPVVKKVSEDNYEIAQMALFDKTKLITILSPEDTRTLNHFISMNPKFTIDVDTKKDQFSFSVESVKLNYTIKTPPDQKPYVQVQANVTGVIEESEQKIKKSRWKEYEKEVAEVSEKRVVDLLKKVQKEKVDPIGFGLSYRSHYGDNWAQWQKIYPEIDFRADVKVDLKMPGKQF